MDCTPCTPQLDALIAQDEAWALAWSQLPQRRLTAGQRLLSQGSSVRSAWRIKKGLVRAYYLSADGRERNRSFCGELEWIAAGVPPQVSSSPFSVEALEQTVLIELPYTQLQDWLTREGLVQRQLLEALTMRFCRSADRESDLLLLDAASRYCAFLDEYGALASRIPLHHVASYLGITGVALSRIRTRLGLSRGRTKAPA